MFSPKPFLHQIMLQLRAGSRILLPIMFIAMLFTSIMTTSSFAAGRPPTATPVNPTPTLTPAVGCTSTANCLAQMTLDEKIGQMTQVNKNALTASSDITTYYLGSLQRRR